MEAKQKKLTSPLGLKDKDKAEETKVDITSPKSKPGVNDIGLNDSKEQLKTINLPEGSIYSRRSNALMSQQNMVLELEIPNKAHMAGLG